MHRRTAHISLTVTGILMISVALAGVGASPEEYGAADRDVDPPEPAKSQAPHSEFTGELLTVLYVSNLPRSVDYYTDVLGFRFDHYYDHHKVGEANDWSYDDSPLYAEMWAGPTRFALHLAQKDYEKRVGGSIHYFAVADVEAHHQAIAERGGEPGELIERPWMHMFEVTDPDGHRLFFQTRPEDP